MFFQDGRPRLRRDDGQLLARVTIKTVATRRPTRQDGCGNRLHCPSSAGTSYGVRYSPHSQQMRSSTHLNPGFSIVSVLRISFFFVITRPQAG